MQVSWALLLQLGALLATLAIVGGVARRFALSPIPVYLLAGLSLGKGGILPLDAGGQFITTGAPIGVVLLLLTLGLEFSAAEFAASLRHHLPSAGSTSSSMRRPARLPAGCWDWTAWRSCAWPASPTSPPRV